MVYNMLVIFNFYFIPFICWFIGAKIKNNFIPSASCWRIASSNPSPTWWRISSTACWRFVFDNWSTACWPFSSHSYQPPIGGISQFFQFSHQFGDQFGHQAGGLFQLFSEKPCEKQKKCLFLHGQIVVRGREQIAFAAIFKLDLSDPHTRT